MFYSFDVVLFELITSKELLGDEYPDRKEANLVNWVGPMVKENQGRAPSM
jgi:hypothetical protein